MWKCNIEELIKRSGLRKDYIASYIGTTTRQLRKYEKFELFIPMKHALLLAKLLGCWVDDFYEEIKEEKDPGEMYIEELELSPRVQNTLKRFEINIVNELIKADLMNIPKLGIKGREEIIKKLNEIKESEQK